MAFDRFRRLCVERILGGLPPHATMHTDLRRLAKAAGLDPITVDRQVLTAVLAAPALRRAPEVFWTAYGPALTVSRPTTRPSAGTCSPSCRQRPRRGLVGAPGGDRGDRRPDSPPPARRPARPSRRKVQPVGSTDSPGTVRRGGPTTGSPVCTSSRSRWRPGSSPTAYRCASSRDRTTTSNCSTLPRRRGPGRRPTRTFGLPLNRLLPQHESIARDLTAVAADPRFLTALFRAVERHLPAVPDRDEVRRVLAVPGLRLAVRAWLDELADTVAAQGLPTLDWHLTRAQKVATPEGRATIPDAIRRIAGHDLAPALAATLRAGILDEYGWPAFERAAGELLDLPLKDERLVLTPQWPALVLRRGGAVRVVGPDDVLLEHQLPVQAARHLSGLVLRFVDGQLLVSWLEGPGRSAYWSGTPTDVRTGLPDDAFTDKHYSYSYSLALPGDGPTAGAPCASVTGTSTMGAGPSRTAPRSGSTNAATKTCGSTTR